MLSYFPIIDERQSCKVLRTQITQKKRKDRIKLVSNIDEADAILVGWWDGFMLKIMRQYYDHQKPFVGYNCWTLGFLMNNIHSIDELPQETKQLVKISSELLYVETTNIEGKKEKGILINDLTIWNSLMDYGEYSITTDQRKQTLQGTWLVVSTSIGITWYALNLGTPLVPLDSDLCCVVGIATLPFHYKFLRPQEVVIETKSRYPVNVGYDWHGQISTNIKEIRIRPAAQFVTLGFCPQQDFKTKRIMLAEQKLLW